MHGFSRLGCLKFDVGNPKTTENNYDFSFVNQRKERRPGATSLLLFFMLFVLVPNINFKPQIFEEFDVTSDLRFTVHSNITRICSPLSICAMNDFFLFSIFKKIPVQNLRIN